ncbi:carbohydrate ABC transporter permease [Planctomonas sp. JC2975]|nr:carbohydrate ABC transporter permease [Planctomonas sp. JC2975]
MDVTPGKSGRARRRRRFSTGSIVLDIVLVVIGILMVSPLVWLISTSLTDASQAFALPPTWIPIPFSVDNFAQVFGLIPFGQMFLNSIIVATLSTAGSLLTSILAAYAFSRLQFRGRQTIFVGILSALMVPVQLTIIPVFILMRTLHLVDTLTALWLPAFINVFAIFFLRQYFNTIPRELDEAARIDGAGHLWILFRMLVPLSGPAISALIILNFQAAWNDYFGPLIFLSSPQNMTLPIGLVTLQSGQGGGPAVIVFAAITMVVVPVLVLFLVFQRSFVSSIASSGIRG